MNRIKFFIIFITLINSTLFAKEDKITLYLDWFNQFQFAGYYIAKEKGFYHELNLDVEIKEFNHNINMVNTILNTKNSYGVGKSSLILDKYNNKDIFLLNAVFQKSPLVLISLKENNITSIKDLENKRVMITNDAIESATIQSLIKTNNIKNIEIQNHTGNIEDLILNNTDAMACYLSNEPIYLDKKGVEYSIIDKNINVDFYEGILFTSKKQFEENSTQAVNFSNASLRGWEYAFSNIEESAKIIYEKYNSFNKSLDDIISEAKVLKRISKFELNLLGKIDKNRIDDIKKFYIFSGINKSKEDFDTKSFIFDRKNLLLSKKEQNYLQNNTFSLIVEDNKFPYSYKFTGDLKGLEVDFWELLGKELNTNFHIEEKLALKKPNGAKGTKKVELVEYKDRDNKDFIYSNPLMKIQFALATKSYASYIPTILALKNVKIAVNKDFKYLNELKHLNTAIEYIIYPTIDEALKAVKKDKVFAYIDDIFTLNYHLLENYDDNLKINNSINLTKNIVFKIEKSEKEFIDIINKGISFIDDEDRDTIYNSYQKFILKERVSYKDILKYVIPLVFITMIILILNFKLQLEVKRRTNVEEQLLKLVNYDELTKIYNRRRTEEILNYEIDIAKRYDSNLTTLFLDLNDFKPINDTYGHRNGDKVLTEVVNLVKRNIRSTDSFGRWGGDEFIIILLQTSASEAENIVKNLKKQILNIEFDFDKSIKMSCSFGIYQYKRGDDLLSIIHNVDKLMYEDKAKYKQNKQEIN